MSSLMTKRRVGAVVAMLLLVPTAGSSQTPNADGAADPNAWTIPSNTAIRELLDQRVGANSVGIVVGAIEPGARRIVTYGKSGAKDGRALDGDTVFQIGSVSKVFAGLVLADMVQRNEVGIEDPVQKYLPANVTMPQRGRPITLIDLSKHWSALPSMPTNFSLHGEPDPYAAYTVDQWYAFLSSYQLPREPGRQVYSNLGVALLGHVLARRAGVDYEKLLNRRVLDPLKLASTSITVTAEQGRRLAPGHDRYLEPVETWEMRVMPASGSIRSTANDLLEFVAYNLGEKPTPLYAAMVYQRTPMRALGWGRSTLGGESVYGHEGGKEGYRSAILFNPRTKTGVVVLMNARTDEAPYALARHLLYPAAPLPPVPSKPMRPTALALKASILDSYAGNYQTRAGDAFAVARDADRLLFDTKGGGIYVLRASSDRSFFSSVDDSSVTFEVDARGKATSLTFTESGTVKTAVLVE